MREVYECFNKLLGGIFNLSSVAVIDLINGLYHCDYETDSKISIYRTDNTDVNMDRNTDIFCVQLQEYDMYYFQTKLLDNGDIVLLSFSFLGDKAMETPMLEQVDYFMPEIRIWAVYHREDITDSGKIYIHAGDDRKEGIPVSIVDVADLSLEDYKTQNILIFMPFILFGQCCHMSEGGLREHMIILKNMVFNDIIPSMQDSYESGDITGEDLAHLKELLYSTYDRLYVYFCESEDYKQLEQKMSDTQMKLTKIKSNLLQTEQDLFEAEQKLFYAEEDNHSMQNQLEKAERELTEKTMIMAAKNRLLLEKERELSEKNMKIRQLQNYIHTLQS